MQFIVYFWFLSTFPLYFLYLVVLLALLFNHKQAPFDSSYFDICIHLGLCEKVKVKAAGFIDLFTFAIKFGFARWTFLGLDGSAFGQLSLPKSYSYFANPVTQLTTDVQSSFLLIMTINRFYSVYKPIEYRAVGIFLCHHVNHSCRSGTGIVQFSWCMLCHISSDSFPFWCGN